LGSGSEGEEKKTVRHGGTLPIGTPKKKVFSKLNHPAIILQKGGGREEGCTSNLGGGGGGETHVLESSRVSPEGGFVVPKKRLLLLEDVKIWEKFTEGRGCWSKTLVECR